MHRSNKKGFTLIEIVISMMFLSFGIMGVIALFFVGVTNGNLSIKNQRATIIADDVREALFNAFKYPRIVKEEGSEKTFKLYRFELPSTLDTSGTGMSLDPTMESKKDIEDSSTIINGFYFQISDNVEDLKNGEEVLFKFTDEEPIENRVLDLPYEGMIFDGGALDFSSIKHQVWRYRGYKFYEEDSDFDEDDSDQYSFRIIIRRSVRYPTTGMLTQGDLLVATVYVFKQYDPTILGEADYTAEKSEFMKYDEEFGYPTFKRESEEEEAEPGIQPILKYEFYIPA